MADEKFIKLICKVCGGPLEFDGSVYTCKACGAKFQDGRTKSQNEILLVSAYDKLRKAEFEDAIENFSFILSKDNACHEAYWGRALAKNGIIYVDDLIDNRKVPTCQRILDKNFLNDEDYLKAVELSNGVVKENYKQQALKIENIRKEWFDKASREKPYDIFICFKDSVRENGLERTPDSYEAQNLYTHLTGLGYRVFFSRESLRDKVSEQYEPYIYAALTSAKVMIVYGQKPEYFLSTWMKNEWSRYARMVTSGDKDANSLIVVYEKCDPSLLPSALKTRQCLDGSKKTFYGDLERHIAKVIENTQKKDEGKTPVAGKKEVQIAAALNKNLSEDRIDLSQEQKSNLAKNERQANSVHSAESGQYKTKEYVNSLRKIQEEKIDLIKADKKLKWPIMLTWILPICFLVSCGFLFASQLDNLSTAFAAYVASIVFAVLSGVECAFVNPKVLSVIKNKRLDIYMKKNSTANENDHYFKLGLKRIKKLYLILTILSFLFVAFIIIIMVLGSR
ncbi:MAG: toll/interleukin-1 receptor domain-containing protein [Eubacteriales bacterium]|nr:toll/interleukin-1 receptor domain-containing protein [Eubacteriales bacterium]